MADKSAETAERGYGGSAFPTEGGVDIGLYPDPGMSLRDWFAGQALAGMLTNGFMATQFGHAAQSGDGNNPWNYAAAANGAADAMLAERAK